MEKSSYEKYIKDIKLVEWEPVFCSKIYSDTEEFSKMCLIFWYFIKMFVHTIFFEKLKITVRRVSSRIARVSSRIPRNRHCPELADLQHLFKSNQKFSKIHKIWFQNILITFPNFHISSTELWFSVFRKSSMYKNF